MEIPTNYTLLHQQPRTTNSNQKQSHLMPQAISITRSSVNHRLGNISECLSFTPRRSRHSSNSLQAGAAQNTFSYHFASDSGEQALADANAVRGPFYCRRIAEKVARAQTAARVKGLLNDMISFKLKSISNTCQ